MLWRRKRIAADTILLFWIVMTGSLVYREAIAPRMFSQSLPSAVLSEQDTWMGIFIGTDRRVGFMHTMVTPGMREGEAGAALDLSARMELNLFGFPAELGITGKAWSSVEAGLRKFDASLRSGEQHFRIEGEVDENLLKARIHTGDQVTPLTFPVDQALLVSGGLGMPSTQLPVLELGESQFVETFDVASMGVVETRLECVEIVPFESMGKTVYASVVEIDAKGLKSKAWIAPDGNVLQASTPFGLTFRVLTAQEALAPFQDSGNADLIDALAVRPTGPAPANGLREMHFRMGGVDESILPASSAYQIRDGNVFSTFQPGPGVLNSEIAPDEEVIASGLEDDPLKSASHPKIREEAARIVGDASSPWEQAELIYAWVYENIEKRPSLGVPTAIEVLNTREGDCNEHTVLFTALARSVGVPTRIAIGLVWSDEINGFGYHAWPEVFVGSWVPMDPTLGQRFADATHIKLLNGYIDQWVQLVSFVGNLEIEIISIR